MRPQVFVSGTWREAKAAPYIHQAERLGDRLAREGFDLACGPGTGISRHVIDGYRAVTNRGTVRYYLPRADLMQAVGEEVADGADEIVQTDFDYAVRNTWQMINCHGLVVLTGGDGALEEILPALIDYLLPVGVVRGTGPAAAAIDALVPIFPEWDELILRGDDVAEFLDEFCRAVHARYARGLPA